MSQMIVKMECRKFLGLNFILCVKNAIKTIIQLNIFSCMSCKKPKRNERRVDSRSMNLSLFYSFCCLKFCPLASLAVIENIECVVELRQNKLTTTTSSVIACLGRYGDLVLSLHPLCRLMIF